MDNTTDTLPELTLLETISQLPSDATIQDLQDLGASHLPAGLVSILMGREARVAGYDLIKTRIMDYMVQNTGPAPGLDAIATFLKTPKDQVSICLRNLIEENKLSDFGRKKATVYFLAGSAPSDQEIQQEILDAIESSETPPCQTDVLLAVASNRFPSSACKRGLTALLKAGSVHAQGAGRGSTLVIPMKESNTEKVVSEENLSLPA